MKFKATPATIKVSIIFSAIITTFTTLAVSTVIGSVALLALYFLFGVNITGLSFLTSIFLAYVFRREYCECKRAAAILLGPNMDELAEAVKQFEELTKGGDEDDEDS